MSSPAAEAAADALQTESDAEQSPEGYTVFAVLRKDPARPDDLDGHDVPRFVRELDDIIALVEDEDVTAARHLRRLRPARRRRRDAVAARPDRRGPAVGAARAAALAPVPRAAAHVERDGRAPRRRVQQGARARLPARRRAEGVAHRLPVRAQLRVVPAAARGARAHARRARPQGRRVPRGHRQHRRVVRARRLRVAPAARGRRAHRPRRPDARPARHRARRHVREEVPFYTGRRISTAELVEVLQ